MRCVANCACECHGDVDVPAPHLATCLWADPSYEPPGMREDMKRIAANFDEAARGALSDLEKYERDNARGSS